MRAALPLKFILLPATLICTYKTFAQNKSTDSSDYIVSKKNAVSLYHQFVSPATNLYNGIEYIDYAYTLTEGNPYYTSTGFVKGNVGYNGVLYNNIPVLYDVLKEEVVIQNPAGQNKIRLHTEEVTSFDLADHHFVKLNADSLNRSVIRTGFYEVLYDNNISLYKKKTKKILESTSISEGLKRTVDEQDGYYIRKSNSYYAVNSKRSLLNCLNDKKKDIQQFMKKNKLKIRQDKESALIKVVAHYDEITKSK